MILRCSWGFTIFAVSAAAHSSSFVSCRQYSSFIIRGISSRSREEHHHLVHQCIHVKDLRPYSQPQRYAPSLAWSRSGRCSTKQSNSVESYEAITLETVGKGIQNGNFRNILILCGAGISVPAGIPDFRTPGSGLYDNLHKYDLPYPEAIFELQYYRKNPLAFITLAKDLWPTGYKYKPTISHSFMKLLDRKGILLRVYTQNIDGLEVLAGVPPERLVECHGHFSSASCIDCGKSYDIEKFRSEILCEPPIVPICHKCGVPDTNKGRVKPDIVFFGEELPQRFSSCVDEDTRECDLLLVLGTSLQVYPVAAIPQWVECPVVLFNRENVSAGQTFWTGKKNIDIFEEGDCDASIRKLCSMVGILDELESIHESTLKRLSGHPQ